jgi:hypothetical protein
MLWCGLCYAARFSRMKITGGDKEREGVEEPTIQHEELRGESEQR